MKPLIILVVLLSFIALSSDQLCWSQYGADSRHTSNIDVNGLLKKPVTDWSFLKEASGGVWRIWGIVTDSDGNIFFVANDEETNYSAHFHSLDKDGKPRWEKTFGCSHNIYCVLDDIRKQIYIEVSGLTAYTTAGETIWSRNDLRGMNHMAISEKGNIYFHRGILYKISPDGTTIWEKDYRIHYEKIPAVDIDETCYIIDENNILNCIDSLGELKWTFNLGTLYGTQTISIGDSTIYYVCDKNLLCIRKDGTEKWRYGFDKAEYDGNGTPSLSLEGNVIFRNNNYIYCFKPDGSIKFQWDSVVRYYNAYPHIIDKEDRIYELDVCLDKEGNPLWENNSSTGDRNLIMDKFGRLIRSNAMNDYYGIVCYKESSGFSDNKSSSNLPCKSFTISPNPFSSRLSISMMSSGAIYSLIGQLIMKLDKGRHTLDTSSWKQGVYIVKSGKECKRVVKIR